MSRRYQWNSDFTVDGLSSAIDDINKAESDRYDDNDDLQELASEYSLPSAAESDSQLGLRTLQLPIRRIVAAKSLQEVLKPENDIAIPVWIPLDFYHFAQETIDAALERHGFPDDKMLLVQEPVIEAQPDEEEGTLAVQLRIGANTMWQRTDIAIDEYARPVSLSLDKSSQFSHQGFSSSCGASSGVTRTS